MNAGQRHEKKERNVHASGYIKAIDKDDSNSRNAASPSLLTFSKLNFTLEFPFVLINRLSADSGRRLKILLLRDVKRLR